MALTPPDLKQCQAEKPNGYSFMTLGGRPGRERCASAPSVLATEADPGEDGLRGSMSLCAECFNAFQKQEPTGRATFVMCTCEYKTHWVTGRRPGDHRDECPLAPHT